MKRRFVFLLVMILVIGMTGFAKKTDPVTSTIQDQIQEPATLQHDCSIIDEKDCSEPSCQSPGWMSYKCSTPGCSYREGHPLTQLEHDMEEWTTIKEATCTDPGLQTRNCKSCRAEIQTESLCAGICLRRVNNR